MYYGTIAMIGITTPGGYYSSFAEKYINYVAWLRALLLFVSKWVLYVFGFDTYLKDVYTLKLHNGSGVHIGYDCIGYGVLFFWMAFIFANKVRLVKKVRWLLTGGFLIFFVNIIRISLMLVAVNRKWQALFNLDSHTLFNIAAYMIIFILIYFFDRSVKKENINL
jgi:exosortase/archaeosortase family protein